MGRCFTCCGRGDRGGCRHGDFPNPIYSALSFAIVTLSVSGLFVLRGALFLAATTVIIYAGAIVVTFLFIIMLSRHPGNAPYDRHAREPFLASLAAFLLLSVLLFTLADWRQNPFGQPAAATTKSAVAAKKSLDETPRTGAAAVTANTSLDGTPRAAPDLFPYRPASIRIPTVVCGRMSPAPARPRSNFLQRLSVRGRTWRERCSWWPAWEQWRSLRAACGPVQIRQPTNVCACTSDRLNADSECCLTNDDDRLVISGQ